MKRTSAKRFFKSHIFRVVVFAVVIFSTAFFPLYFALPILADENRIILAVIAVIGCAVETVAYVLVEHYFAYSKIDDCSHKLTVMSRDENYDVKADKHIIDNSVTALSDAVDATAAEYKRLEQVRKSFVSNASHELRTPLTSVQGFLQAVLDGTVSEEDKEKYLSIALSETKRLNVLISSMLDLSRLESGKNPIIPVKFDINSMIREVATRFEPSLIKKTLQINVDCSQDTCYVYADKDKIFQVITNLVDNAIKYSPSYSRIILTASIHENKVYVTVRDFGYGISKKDQMLIWDSFYMTDRSRSPIKTKGSGLGLSIVKKIIDEHDEVIWVESSRGAGATFIFTLTLFDETKHADNKGRVIKTSDEDAEQSRS